MSMPWAMQWLYAMISDGPGYASPIVAELDGVRQVITETQKHIVGVNARSGQLLWQIPFTTSYDQNSVTPLLAGDILILSGLGSGVMGIRAGRSSIERLWHTKEVSMYMSSPVLHRGYLYGLTQKNRGQFFAIDAATGKTLWTTKGREAENASIVRAGDYLLLSTTNSELIVARANAQRYEEVKRYSIADSAMWAHPAYAGRSIIVKDVDTLIAWTF